MPSKTVIALAVAGLLTAPLALAQYDKDRSVSSDAPGSAAMPANPNATGKANEEKGTPPPAGESARGGADASASSADVKTPRSKRRAERISRNDRGTYGTEASPNMPRDPRSSGNPPKQGSSPEPQ
jgi:hypothetical protein